MDNRILLAHGGGGRLTADLIRNTIRARFKNPRLDPLDDSALLDAPPGRLAFTTDSYVVSPPFFPGGNIGDLAICGTVNDLAMAGAVPRWLSMGLILEEGFELALLEKILDAARTRAEEAGVEVVTGDTKVVPRGQADSIYINTAGIGIVPDGIEVGSNRARPGDRIIVSGPPGLHGLAVMLHRSQIDLAGALRSDVAPLNHAVAALIEKGIKPRVLRDLTRGGLTMALVDIAENSRCTCSVEEDALPVTDAQEAACDLLGLDLWHVASEGCFLAVVAPQDVDVTVDVLRKFEPCREAANAGEIREPGRHGVERVTAIGSRRVVIAPRGELLPRIC